ncbi:MAG: beta-ketoacyl-ACP synthase III [Acidobacteriota bacterium]|nr:ketoacyl-ACP synthase III [Blastocatellia bacterium]MDW8239725.1 beta-ketoacyl-ACP synthase III [Acidobacteriota bacterium]
MEVRTVGITGIGAYVPEKVVTNADLEPLLQTTDAWIRQRMGVMERRVCTEEQATSDLAVPAAQMALEAAGLKPVDVEMIINATMTPDRLWPSAGSTIQGRLGAVNAAACDINAACSGFVYALAVGTQMVRAGLYRKVLVIGADAISKFLRGKNPNGALFGDGAGAVVLEPIRAEEEGIIDFVLHSDGSRGDILQLPAGGSRLPSSHRTLDEGLNSPVMDGYDTFEFAATAVMDSIEKVLAKTSYTINDVDLIVPHQANQRLFRPVAKWLGVPVEKFFVNIERYGNTVAGSVPIALYEAVQQGRLKRGDLVVLSAFGAGLTWAGAAVRWTM